MTPNRRKFLKNAAFFSLGIGFLSTNQLFAKQVATSRVNSFCKGKENKVEVKGILQDHNFLPIKNATIEITHSQDKTGISDYKGKLKTNDKGEYNFITDLPEKHNENGNLRLRRISFRVNGESNSNLYFDHMGYGNVDHEHVNNAPNAVQLELPKTTFKTNNLTQVEFNLFSKSKTI